MELIRNSLPINVIKKDSKVVLYGAGKFGKNVYLTNLQCEWFECIGVVDSNYAEITDFPIGVNNPESITLYDKYDYILVCILNKDVSLEIKNKLVLRGIKEKAIILLCDYYYLEDDLLPKENEVNSDTELSLAIQIGSGLGDAVVFLAFLQAFRRLIPDAHFYIFTPNSKLIKELFYNQENVIVVDYKYVDNDVGGYDAVLKVMFEPRIIVWNKTNIVNKSIELWNIGQKLIKYQSQVNSIILDAYENHAIAYLRARTDGGNRYSLLSAGGIINLSDCVTIYKNPDYITQFDALELGDFYITINCSADRKFSDGKTQTKQWPIEYYNELICRMKQDYPNLLIVQIGDGETIKLDGVDRYILGQSLEIAKYVLEKSRLHIDIEGGLVHLATQLGTKCIVLFGPTPIDFYGYKQNINIRGNVCGECSGAVKDWQSRCYKYEKAECMYSIKPQTVLDRIKECIKSE